MSKPLSSADLPPTPPLATTHWRRCICNISRRKGPARFLREAQSGPAADRDLRALDRLGWLVAKLEERGEVIQRDFYGLTIWGCACTGQAILIDSFIYAIYDELHPDPLPYLISS